MHVSNGSLSQHGLHPATPIATRSWAGFLATFVLAWFSLDRLVTSPPTVVSSSAALGAATLVLVGGEVWFFGSAPRDLARRLGLVLPNALSLLVAAAVGGAVIATYVLGAAAFGIELELRPNWPTVLAGALLFHGAAEELVWRGFAFGHLRRSAPYRVALVRVVPLIALTHVPIMATMGVSIGLLAVLSAAITCLPLAHLWERGRRSIWPPAILHGLIGAWQLYDRSYDARFHVVILTASIVVPLAACAFGDWFFGSSDITHSPRLTPTTPQGEHHEHATVAVPDDRRERHVVRPPAHRHDDPSPDVPISGCSWFRG